MTRFRLILPSRFISASAALILVIPLFYAIVLTFLGLHSQELNGHYLIAMLAAVPVAFIYGIYRVVKFHPDTNQRYRDWLATTPWTYGKPLPLGPLRLVWEDAVIIACLIGVAIMGQMLVEPAVLAKQSLLPESPFKMIGLVVIAFLCGHLICLATTITIEQSWAGILVLVAAR